MEFQEHQAEVQQLSSSSGFDSDSDLDSNWDLLVPPSSGQVGEVTITDAQQNPVARSLNNPEPNLCPEQQHLVDLILQGRNVFYTGSAGCGKSTVLKAALTTLRNKGQCVYVVAPTGRAALQVNGMSTWSYMGWTPDHHKLTMKKLKTTGFRTHVQKRLRETDVIIIDEISMVENHHLERMNVVMKEARQFGQPHQDPFGGVQVVVTGDFCQLPPVKPFQQCITCGLDMKANDRETEYDCENNHGPFSENSKWAFMSDAWEECKFEHVHLKQIHRQSDEYFIKMLQKCRLGIPLSPSETLSLMDHPCNVSNATRLFSTRKEVHRVNRERFTKLRTPVVAYQNVDGFFWRWDEHPYLESYNDRFDDGSLKALKDHRLERQVALRVGMLVVLQVNLDLQAGLCNGSQGIICGFEDHDPALLPTAQSSNRGRTRPGEPSTIHGDYAALKEVEIRNFMNGQRHRVWPRVLFHNGIKRTIYADCTVNSVGKEPYSLLHRTQIPLMAAWAMSIHKSQGMTLDRVIVDVTRAFEEGQVYVALSRATSLDGLKVEGSPEGLSVGRGGNPDVQEFLRTRFGPGFCGDGMDTSVGNGNTVTGRTADCPILLED